MKVIRDAKLFYSFCIILAIGLLLIRHYIFIPVPALPASILNVVVFALLLLVAEQIIVNIYKGPLIEIRILLFLFLFLSPFMQYSLIYYGNTYYSIFFLLFSFYNFTLSEKFSEKGFLIISLSSILLSTYFYSYSAIAALPLLLYILFNKGLTGFISVTATVLLLFLFYFLNIVSFNFIALWSFNNFLASGSGIVSYKTLNIFFAILPVFHPVFFVAGIVAVPLLKGYDFNEDIIKILLISYIIYSIFLVGLPFQSFDMLTITYPFLLILFYPALTRIINLTEYFRPKWKNHLPYLIVVIQLFIFYLLNEGYFKVTI